MRARADARFCQSRAEPKGSASRPAQSAQKATAIDNRNIRTKEIVCADDERPQRARIISRRRRIASPARGLSKCQDTAMPATPTMMPAGRAVETAKPMIAGCGNEQRGFGLHRFIRGFTGPTRCAACRAQRFAESVPGSGCHNCADCRSWLPTAFQGDAR